ncbi:MAG: PEP-CTERM sorting domain-containing protein [Bryobacterales bacterium]|nr:PEP-CTERM sorting domain-containing protein [Bryobacterales bacterium]
MKRKSIVATLAVLPTVFVPLEAATITATFEGALFSNSVTRIIADGPTYGLPGGSTNVGASLFRFSTVNGSFYAYCIEPQQGVGSATFTLDPSFALVPGNIHPTTTLTAAKIADLKLLFGQVANPFSPALGRYVQAALQVGIWEIVRETASSYDITTGNVRFTAASDPSILTLAQGYLNNVNNDIGTPMNNIIGLYNSTFQDVVTQTPEPGMMALVGIGLIWVGLRRRPSAH